MLDRGHCGRAHKPIPTRSRAQGQQACRHFASLETLDETSWVVHFDRAGLSDLSDFILTMHTKNDLLIDCMKSQT